MMKYVCSLVKKYFGYMNKKLLYCIAIVIIPFFCNNAFSANKGDKTISKVISILKKDDIPDKGTVVIDHVNTQIQQPTDDNNLNSQMNPNNMVISVQDIGKEKKISSASSNDGEEKLLNMDLNVTSNKTNKNISVLHEDAYKAYHFGQLEAAEHLYRKIIKLDKNDLDALFALATIAQQNMSYSQAREIYKKILNIRPNHLEALNNFLILMAEETPQLALQELKKLEAVEPESGIFPAQIGLLYYRMDDYDRSIKYLRKAIRLEPENYSYMYSLARVIDKMGDKESAYYLYRQLLEASNRGAVVPESKEMLTSRMTALNS
jgi:tetratricopeptide (TPR) repeat protein